MGKLVLMPFVVVLIFVLCEHLILQANAKFLIETYGKNKKKLIVRLYECDVPDSEKKAPSSFSAVSLSPSCMSQEFHCIEVLNKEWKQYYHAVANFYLVVDPWLSGGKRIILGSNSAVLPFSFFLGVQTVGAEPARCPDFVVSLNPDTFVRMREMCKATLPDRFLGGTSHNVVADYMLSLVNLLQFSHPYGRAVSQFLTFAKIVQAIPALYFENSSRAKKNMVSKTEQATAKKDLKSAVGLLVQKMIDPCFVMYYLQEMSLHAVWEGKRTNPMELGNTLCKNHCVFLQVAFALHPSFSPNCARSIVGGLCENKVCLCERTGPAFLCTGGYNSVSMVKCSNELRMTLAATVKMGL